MITTSKFFDKRLFEDKERQLVNRIILSNVDIGTSQVNQEVSTFTSRFGTIRREVEYDKGLFRPASHSFQLDNNLDISAGKELLSKRIELQGNTTIGTKTWITKQYDVYTGVKGTPENGNQDEYVHLYTGIIDKRNHNRITNKISVSSQDASIKSLLQKKVCGKILKNTVMQSTAYGNEMLQQYIRYGIHRFPVSEGGSVQANDIEKFGSCVPGTPNDLSIFYQGGTEYPPGYVFYFPLINDTEMLYSDFYNYPDKVRIWFYYPTGNYWCYFRSSEFSIPDVKLTIGKSNYSDAPGLYMRINPTHSVSYLNVNKYDGVYGFVQYTDFISWVLAGTTKVVMEIMPKKTVHSASTSCYPITVLYDLLTSSRFGNIPVAELDESSMNVTPNSAYSFDALYSYYAGIGESDCFRLRVDSEKSIQDILGELCRYCGIFLLTTGKNQASPDSTISDRHIKVAIMRPFVEATDMPNTRIYSTNAEVSGFNTDEVGFALYQKIQIGYLSYHPGQYLESQRVEFFEGIVAENQYVGDDSIITFGESRESMCLFWTAPLNVAAVSAAYKDKYCEPNDLVDIEIDCRGLVHFPSEYIGVYNHRTGELIVFQIYTHEYDLDSTKVKLSGYAVYSSYGMSKGNLKPTIERWTEGGSAGSPRYTEGGSAGSPRYTEVGKGA